MHMPGEEGWARLRLNLHVKGGGVAADSLHLAAVEGALRVVGGGGRQLGDTPPCAGAWVGPWVMQTP